MEWGNKKGVPYTQPAQHIMFTPRKKKSCLTAKGNQNYHNSNSPKLIQNR